MRWARGKPSPACSPVGSYPKTRSLVSAGSDCPSQSALTPYSPIALQLRWRYAYLYDTIKVPRTPLAVPKSAMSEKTAEEVIELLEQDPQLLVDQQVYESAQVEFKLKPHWDPDLRDVPTLHKQKLELAKDVSAIANSQGGVIIIGVDAPKDLDSHLEVATDVVGVETGKFDPSSVKNVIREWVYPRLEVLIRGFKIVNGPHAGKQVWAIIIKRGREAELPFMVSRSFQSEEMQKVSPNSFSIFERHDADVTARTPSDVHREIQGPGRYRRRDGDDVTSSIVAETPEVAHAPPAVDAIDPDDVLSSDVDQLRLELGQAFYAVQIKTSSPRRIASFFQGSADSVFDELRAWLPTRQHGFSLPYGEKVNPIRQGLRSGLAGRESISVMIDGLTSAVTSETMITWGHQKVSTRGRIQADGTVPFTEIFINPLALVEFTLEAARFFVRAILPKLAQNAFTDFSCRTVMQGVEGSEERPPLALPKYGIESAGVVLHHPGIAHQGISYVGHWQTVADLDPEKLAYELAAQVYENFGWGPELIMLAVPGERRVDGSKIPGS
jgi:schlafen family protein